MSKQLKKAYDISMIASLEGIIELKTDKIIILDVGCVGYRVFCPLQVLAKLPQTGEKAKLFVHSYVREDSFDLYGFLTYPDLEFFELLISVSGIGPKAALAIMSIASLKDLKASVASGQVNLLTKVSGVGKKTAERVILELRNKITASVATVKGLQSDQDAVEALVSLGYTSNQARAALDKVPGKIKEVEDRIKEALKILGK